MADQLADRVHLKAVRPAEPGMWLELFGDDELSGGVGVWDTVNRPRRRDGVQWAGTSGFVYVLPLVLDGMGDRPSNDRSVETECRTLLRWASAATKATGEPCVVRASGPLKTPAEMRWVITDLQWGAQIRNKSGRRVQQQVTVTLVEYLEPKVVRSPAKRARDRHKK